jgi:hypothetical protein
MDKRFPQYDELDLLRPAGTATLLCKLDAHSNWYHL